MLTREYPRSVELKDGRTAVFRPLKRNDADRLREFFGELPEEDRLFLRHDVSDPDLVHQWTERIDFTSVIPLVAEDDDRFIGEGSLHVPAHKWRNHVGQVRLVTARGYRRLGLGGLLVRELLALAAELNLERLEAEVMEDNSDAMRMFRAIGFETSAVLRGMVKDRRGNGHNLAVMTNRVTSIRDTLDDWIQDSMIPAYRVPGAGV